MVADYLAGRAGVDIIASKWSAYYAKARVAGRNIYFVKPDTFMNLSGQAIARFLDFYKCPSENLLVIHDDLDMSPGRFQLAREGGAGEHNGIKSIINCISSKKFFRLKFGIGRPDKDGVHPEFPVDKFVLAPFSKDESELVNERLPIIEEGVLAFLESDPQKAMNILNSMK